MPTDWENYLTQCLVAKKATFHDEGTVRAESIYHYSKDVIDNPRQPSVAFYTKKEGEDEEMKFVKEDL